MLKIFIVMFFVSCSGVKAKLEHIDKRDFLFMIGIPTNIVKIENKQPSLVSKDLITIADRVSVKVKPVKVFNLYTELDNNYGDSIEFVTTSHAGSLKVNEEVYLIFEIVYDNKLKFIRWSTIQKTICLSNDVLDELGLKNQFNLINPNSNYRCDTLP